MTQNPARRAALGEAAIRVLAEEGARGLTFRAVDAAAELPVGTANNYFASRAELLEHAATHIRDRIRIERPEGASLAELLHAQFARISEDRTSYLALLELRLEATRRPRIRELLTPIVREELAERGAGDPEATLLYLSMLGMAVEHLTLPEALGEQSPSELLLALAERFGERN